MKTRHKSQLPINTRPHRTSPPGNRASGPQPCTPQAGSVLIIVLWISLGLVSIALYFANSMTYELRASDNRVGGMAADQAVEGAARYVSYVLQNFATNGTVPDTNLFNTAAVSIGEARFWIVGRNPSDQKPATPTFGLVDEGAKLNLNTVNTNVLAYLPNMTTDFAQAILDWRGTNGSISLDYATQGYTAKNAPFETIDELRLVYGATMGLLAGEDVNRNGILDPNEKDLNSNGQMDPGLLDCVTVYTREPNFYADGSSPTNVNTATESRLITCFKNCGVSSATAAATALYRSIHISPARLNTCSGTLDLAVRCRTAGLNSSDFARVAPCLTTSTNAYLRGRVNVNTATAPVLTALFMGLDIDESTASGAVQTLITYRDQNAGNLATVAWVIDALGNKNPVLTALVRGDFLTTHSYQFTADIAATGPFGRGYRRVKFIFDTSNGGPVLIYRQDLSRLGWALGEEARQSWIAKQTP